MREDEEPSPPDAWDFVSTVYEETAKLWIRPFFEGMAKQPVTTSGGIKNLRTACKAFHKLSEMATSGEMIDGVQIICYGPQMSLDNWLCLNSDLLNALDQKRAHADGRSQYFLLPLSVYGC